MEEDHLTMVEDPLIMVVDSNFLVLILVESLTLEESSTLVEMVVEDLHTMHLEVEEVLDFPNLTSVVSKISLVESSMLKR